MNNHDDYPKRKIAFVGDYLPRKCGIATFTADLRNSVAARYPDVECLVVSVTDQEEGYDYPEEVRFEMKEEDLDGYKRAADFLNFNNVEVVSLQHEFGIYGGPCGEHILTLLRNLQMPVVTTLHTVLPKFDDERQQNLEELLKLSTRVVIMTERGQEFLEKDFGVPSEKIHLIPHGIPDMPFVDPNFYKDEFNVEGKTVLLTFGLLTQAKGIEYVLQALPDIVDKYPNLVYIVLGATHPDLVRREGEAYRESLEAIVKELGLEQHVVFCNQFVPKEELLKYIGMADLYITPYLYREQITSGTLAYAFGCGKAVISTPYWYAEDLLTDNRGKLVPFEDSKAIAETMIYLLENEVERHAMRKNAYKLGREMIWLEVAELYMHSFQEARLIRHSEPVVETDTNKVVRQQKNELPPLRLHQLFRLTDSIGIVQHSRFHIPYIKGGYCTDDNARALVLTTRLQEMGKNETELRRSADKYAAFIQYAFEPEQHRFHSALSFDRQWRDEAGPDETQGRVIWALGTCVGRSTDPNLKKWATQLIDQVGPIGKDLQTPLAWAFTLLGVHEYFRQLSGDRPLGQLRDLLTQRLVDLYNSNASDNWPWFEKTLSSYESAKLAHALIESGRWIGNDEALQIGLKALRWLVERQAAVEGYFRPVGYTDEKTNVEDPEHAQFEQYPIETYTTISACVEAYHATNNTYWLVQIEKAFNWFLGLNDLGQPLYDAETGGSHDALQIDRLNQNQGAEATLSFLLSLTELYAVSVFKQLNWSELPERKTEEQVSPLFGRA